MYGKTSSETLRDEEEEDPWKREEDVEIIAKIHSDKVSVISANCSEAFDPCWIVSWIPRREELFCHWVSISKVFAILLLQQCSNEDSSEICVEVEC